MTSAAFLLAAVSCAAPQPATDLKLPAGFMASVYSDQTLANDVYTMTIDEAGRVLVAGRGYVRVLVDDDGDGRADRAIDLIDNLKGGPMGLLAEGDSLYVVVDGGLKRYRGYNGKDKLKTPPETLLAVKAAGEHEAHAVRRGPDGWLYLLCGNMSGVKKEQIDPNRSPVKEPVAGYLLRIGPDGKTVEVVADGFRNAYDFDFNTDGEPLAYDSDNERCVGLPWYEGCRLYHIVPGGNYGWRSPQLSQTWRKPPYFMDVVPPICTTGRGSPTGVACYRSTQFPEPYRGSFFLADWTFGRVYHVPLQQKHSSYTGKPEVFLQAIGESGFAPTALAVRPQTGELFVSIGGRGTRGAVYRIRYERGGTAKQLPVAKRSLEWDAEAAKQWLTDATGNDGLKRRQALEQMLRWREKLGFGPKLFDAVLPNLKHDDPLVRAAAGRLVAAAAIPTDHLKDTPSRLAVGLADMRDNPRLAGWDAAESLSSADPQVQCDAIRLIQIALGDLTAPNAVGTVWEGYTFRKPVGGAKIKTLMPILQSLASSKDPAVAREATRTLAAIGPAAGMPIGVTWRAFTPESSSQDDIHNLIVIVRVGGMDRAHRSRLASALLDLDRKVERERQARDRFWPVRVEEVATALAAQSPELGEAILENREFGRPEHLLFVKPLKLDRQTAARKFIAASAKNPDYPWTPGLVALLGSLPPAEARPMLLKLWDHGGLEEAIASVLAISPNPADADKLLVGLRSFDPALVQASAAALAKLPGRPGTTEVLAAVQALRRLPDDKSTVAARDSLASLLRQRTGQTFAADPKVWADWFNKAHPDQVARLASSDGFDATAWEKREANIPWGTGDPAQGRKVFAKATCAACHDGGGAVGPSLVGVSKRFSRDDLLTAILQPSKDVSPRFRPVRVTTTDGKSFMGMVIYEATDSLILQTGADTSVRIAGEQVEAKKGLDTSLMPVGLLDKLTDREVADLLAYLRTLN